MIDRHRSEFLPFRAICTPNGVDSIRLLSERDQFAARAGFGLQRVMECLPCAQQGLAVLLDALSGLSYVTPLELDEMTIGLFTKEVEVQLSR